MADEPVDPAEAKRRQRRTTLITIAVMVPWVIGWIWLMGLADYPKSFGFSLGHGKGALVVALFESYLLVERHHLWDLALFIWMWAPIAGGIGWWARKRIAGWTRPRISLFDDAS